MNQAVQLTRCEVYLSKKIYTGRRNIIGSKLKGFKAIFAFSVVTAWGAGLFPIAPGTAGTLMGLPLAYYTSEFHGLFRVAFWLALTWVGSWAASYFDQLMGTQDNQNIVIDEVIGVAITSWTAGNDWKVWLAAFLLFRFFDVIKIPPVRQIDQWSKKKSNPFWSGFGVIADDIVAGFQGLIVILVLQKLQIF